jgi:hypothetical protein
MDFGDASELVSLIFDEWNKAEKAIKIAEQVNGEIINPAVYELRYSGRRLVEALGHLQNNDNEKANKLLHDAHFDCCRARHDAIDAATTKISNDLAIAVRKIGPRIVLDKFPNYTMLIKELNLIRTLIVKSREDRNNRDAIYESIASDNLTTIVGFYAEFQACEPILRTEGRWSRAKLVLGALGWIVATALAIFKK